MGKVLKIFAGVVLVVLLAVAGIAGYVYQMEADMQLNVLTKLLQPTLKLSVQPARFRIQNLELRVGHESSFTLLLDNKKVLNEGFLSCYSAEPTVDAGGDSFYKVNTEVKKQCRSQVINNVSKEDLTITVTGTFIDCPGHGFEFAISLAEGSFQLNGKCLNSDQSIAIWMVSDKHDKNFGLGEQFSYLSLGDRPYSLLVREKGVGRGDQPISLLSELAYKKAGTYYSSYSPSPAWFNSRRLAWIVRSLSYVAWSPTHIVTWSNSLKLNIITGESMRHLLAEIARVNGYTPPVPKWVNRGAIVGLQGGSKKVREIMSKLRKAGAEIGGVWLQDWVGKRMSLGYSRLWWNWELDTDHYSDWNQLRIEMKAEDTNLLIYMNPMLADTSSKSKYTNNYFLAAKEHLVKDKNGEVFLTSAFSDFKAGLVNIFKPEAREFLKSLIKKVIKETGAMGMMTDFGQSYPFADNPIRDVIKHNDYPVQWLKLAHQAVQEELGKNNDFFSFSRAGYLGAPKWTRSLWAGDQNMNFGRHNGLPSCLNAMLTSGLVGYSNTHCDIGGYVYASVLGYELAARTEILMLRWMQLAAFSPVFRTHEGNQPDKTLQIYSNDYMINAFAFWSKVYRALSDYRWEQAKQSQKESIPLLRPMFLELEDESLSDIADQYYVGNWMMVAPLLSESDERTIFLPEGEWVNLWNGKPEIGCNCFKRKTMLGLPLVYIYKGYPQTDTLLRRIQKLLVETPHLSDSIKEGLKSPPEPGDQL